MKVLVLNGPNLGRLGRRQPEIYGTTTHAELAELCVGWGTQLGLEVEVRQTNHEGELLDWLNDAADEGTPVVLNAAAWTHYSWAIFDACAQLTAPLVEVHISDPSQRPEEFRHTSVVTPHAVAVVAGRGRPGLPPGARPARGRPRGLAALPARGVVGRAESRCGAAARTALDSRVAPRVRRGGRRSDDHEEARARMASTNDLKNGMVLNIDGQLWAVIEFQHVKPGKGPAFVRTKLKNVLSNKTVDKTFNAGTKVETATVDKRTMQYLYNDGTSYVFMDTSSYEQLEVPPEVVGNAKNFMLENQDAIVATHEGRVLFIELPASVELLIKYTEPGLQGDRSSGGTKPATLETGHTINVPLFITTGEKVKVDTRDSSYLGRVSS